MSNEDCLDRDLFGEPLCVPSPALLETLARPDLLDVLGAARLMRDLSPVLRGDDTAAGWTILLDGLPAVFPLGMNHALRSIYAVLAGLVADPVLARLPVALPAESAIQAARARLACQLAARLRAAAARADSIAQAGA
jgi:hypothetical protein